MSEVTQLLDAGTIAKLKEQHGDALISVNGIGTKLVFRRPTRIEWERFQDEIQNERKSKSVTIRSLATQCAVWPDAGSISAAFEKLPGLPTTVVAKLAELVGLPDTADVEKL